MCLANIKLGVLTTWLDGTARENHHVRAVGRYSSRCASLAFQASHPIVDGCL